MQTTDEVVALTFDDGPIPGHTEATLGILADLQIPATFFVIGGSRTLLRAVDW